MSSSAALSMTHKEENAWRNFNPGDWCTSIAVRDFIVRNATLYAGDEKFLARSDRAHQSGLGQAASLFRRGAEERRACGGRQDTLDAAGAQAGLHRSEK